MWILLTVLEQLKEIWNMTINTQACLLEFNSCIE